MRLLLLDTRNDRHYVSDRVADLVTQTGQVWFNLSERRAVIKGSPDGVRIGLDYSEEEMVRELATRALHVLLCDHGFILYRRT